MSHTQCSSSMREEQCTDEFSLNNLGNMNTRMVTMVTTSTVLIIKSQPFLVYKLTALFDSEWGGRLVVCCETSHSPSLPELLSGTCHLSTPPPPPPPPLHSSQVDGTIHSNQTPNAEAKITWNRFLYSGLIPSLLWSHSKASVMGMEQRTCIRLYLSLQ